MSIYLHYNKTNNHATKKSDNEAQKTNGNI
jgi:hypothetical protein